MKAFKETQFVCPVHRLNLIKCNDSSLQCPTGCQFPIAKGIPRFVPLDNYSAAFGEQWKRYRKTQLDSYTGTPLSGSRLRRCLGEELWRDLEGKHVLEAGCGAGRFTEVLLAEGANVTSVDLSDAVTANQENFPQDDHHRIAQADILNLPFEKQKYDIVLCLGVIQHTPSPEETIGALYDNVKPGGWLVIDHYRFRFRFVLRTAPLFRMFMKRMPRGKTIALTEKMVDMLLPLHKAVRNFRPAQTVLSRFSPLVVYYHGFPHFSDELQREWALLDTHDSLTDYYKRFRSRGQIRAILAKLGLEDIWCEYGGNGVEARGRRPINARS
jgi:2-polyprenyl-3-methyl-5-hydroxy-6-metoxy-1,4-benzoquinol methylase